MRSVVQVHLGPPFGKCDARSCTWETAETKSRMQTEKTAETKVSAIIVIGGVAQLGEHLPCKQGVSGSIPLVSTNVL